ALELGLGRLPGFDEFRENYSVEPGGTLSESVSDFRDFEDILSLFPGDECIGRNVVLDHQAWIHRREVETGHVIVQPNFRLEDNRSFVGNDRLFGSRRY